MREVELSATARSVLISFKAIKLRSISASRACSRISSVLLRQEVHFEQRLGLGQHRSDGREHLPEGDLIEPEAALDGEAHFREGPLLRLAQEQIGDGTGLRDAALEDESGIVGHRQIHAVAVTDGAKQARRQVPTLHEPRADLGMIGVQSALLDLGQTPMVALVQESAPRYRSGSA